MKYEADINNFSKSQFIHKFDIYNLPKVRSR